MHGVPTMFAFFSKLLLLNALNQACMMSLEVGAVNFAVIGAFYYIRVVKVMYFDKPEDEAPFVAGTDTKIIFSINGLTVLALGLFPTALMSVCTTAIG